MASELTFEQRQLHLFRLLGSDVSFAASADLPSNSAEEDNGSEIVTLHDVRDNLLKKDAEKKAKKTANKTSGKPTVYTPPSSAKQDPEKAQQLAMVDFPEFKGRKPGEMSEPGEIFMPWDLAIKYPQLYIGKTNRIKAIVFFENILEGLAWDFHYLYNPQKLAEIPKLLVPTKQFERFLDFVNANVGIQLTIPPDQPGEKFSQTFGDTGLCRPRYLARTTTGKEFKDLENLIPLYDEHDVCEGASSTAIEELFARLEVTTRTKHEDKKKEKAAKKREKASKDRLETIRLVQRWLGIEDAGECLVNLSGDVLKFDVQKAVPYECFSDVVFAAVDVEVAERSPGLILEIGISVLDTRDVSNVPPGENGQNWFSLIKSHHLITHDYRFMCNHRYVKGCPDAFNFGQSEYPKLGELAARVREIIDAHVKPNDGLTPGATASAISGDEKPRRLVIVGHGVESDVKYISNCLKFDLATLQGFHRYADTQDMHQFWRDLPNGRKLGTILDELTVLHTHLHNAGNDAAYTLQAMIGLAVRARLDRLSDKAQLESLRDEQCRERTGTTEEMEQSRRSEYEAAVARGERSDLSAYSVAK